MRKSRREIILQMVYQGKGVTSRSGGLLLALYPQGVYNPLYSSSTAGVTIPSSPVTYAQWRGVS